jgi:hypothetical protein
VRIRFAAFTSTPRPVRVLIGLHVCLGAPLLMVPSRVVGALPHQRIDRSVRLFARILGARHLAEAAVLARRHTHDWILAGAAVDATHALCMLLLARLEPAQRKLALTNAAGAACLAACSVHYDQRERLAGTGYAETRG